MAHLVGGFLKQLGAKLDRVLRAHDDGQRRNPHHGVLLGYRPEWSVVRANLRMADEER